MESAFIKMYQIFCETPGFAACRAYSTITSGRGRSSAIRAAASSFFETPARDINDFTPVKKLLKAYDQAAQYRNNIAHGMAVGTRDENGVNRGYFLSAPSYSKKSEMLKYSDRYWWLSAQYFYRDDEINLCNARFEEIMGEAMQLLLALNKKYQVLEGGELHP